MIDLKDSRTDEYSSNNSLRLSGPIDKIGKSKNLHGSMCASLRHMNKDYMVSEAVINKEFKID